MTLRANQNNLYQDSAHTVSPLEKYLVVKNIQLSSLTSITFTLSEVTASGSLELVSTSRVKTLLCLLSISCSKTKESRVLAVAAIIQLSHRWRGKCLLGARVNSGPLGSRDRASTNSRPWWLRCLKMSQSLKPQQGIGTLCILTHPDGLTLAEVTSTDNSVFNPGRLNWSQLSSQRSTMLLKWYQLVMIILWSSRDQVLSMHLAQIKKVN